MISQQYKVDPDSRTLKSAENHELIPNEFRVCFGVLGFVLIFNEFSFCIHIRLYTMFADTMETVVLRARQHFAHVQEQTVSKLFHCFHSF